MKWIDVNDDLPPKGVRVLGHVQFKEDGPYTLSDVSFDPAWGWESWGYSNRMHQVYHWHPLSEMPPLMPIDQEAIRRSSEAFQAACEKLADNQLNHPASDQSDS